MLSALIGIATPVVIVLFIMWVARARKDSEPAPVIRVALAVAAIWAGVSLVGGIITAIGVLVGPQVQISVPVQQYWPALPSGTTVEGTTATRVGGGFHTADLSVEELSMGARIMWAISQALWWFVPAAIAALIAVACVQLLSGRAFAPILARMAMITAVIVTVGGVAAQMLGDIAGSLAAVEVLHWTAGDRTVAAGIEDVLDAWVPKPGFSVSFPFWPLAAGLGFAALATVFRHGTVLQRDAEGLV